MTPDNFADMEFLSILEDVEYMKDVYETIIPDIAQWISDSPAPPREREFVSMEKMVFKSQLWDKLMLALRDKLKYQIDTKVREMCSLRPEEPGLWGDL